MDIGFRYSRCVIVTLTPEDGREEKEFVLPWQLGEALSFLYSDGPECPDHRYEEDPDGKVFEWDNFFEVPPRFREHDRDENGECSDAYRFRRCQTCGRIEPHPDRQGAKVLEPTP